MLKLEGLTKRFGDMTAVDAVDLEVPSGQFLGIIGRSGAGKSTLLRTLNRLSDASDGRILFEDESGVVDVNSLSGNQLRNWRSRCAMIFQQFNLVGRLNVITNVLMGRINYSGTLKTLFTLFSPAERAFAIRALDRLDVSGQALQRADTLSGGQQQRVAIARALVQEPKILLADEPIASLDPRNAQIVMEALKTINKEDGITVICNLHTLDTAKKYCDRVIGMKLGKVIFDSAPSKLTDAKAREIYMVGEGEEDEEFSAAVTSTTIGNQ
ncbi:MAG: phosphonate ABC transporter ATP-binding protein [Hyphomicrobiales bacterium]|nr:phosphonate ABC transporter ATP-binding protein [Hyphomicrobiales bacterium]